MMPAPWVRGAVLACAEAGGEPRCVPDFATARWDGCFSPGHWERSRRAAGRLRVWSPLTALRRPSLPRLAAEAFLLWRPASAAEVRSGAWEPSEGGGSPHLLLLWKQRILPQLDRHSPCLLKVISVLVSS